MKALAGKYWLLIKIYLKEYKLHKLTVFFKLIELPFQMLMYLFLWAFIARTSNVDYAYMVLYYLLTGLLSLSYPFLRISLDVQADIMEGGIANAMVRPYSYVMPYLCKYIAWMCIYSVVYLPIILYLLLVQRQSPIGVVFFVISSVLGMLIEFMTWFSIGLLALYFGKINGAIRIVAAMKAIVSGSLIPLYLMPKLLQDVTAIFPFQFFVYVPVNNLLNQVSMQEQIMSIGFAMLWLLFLSIAANWLWICGKKRIQIGIS